MGRFEFAVGDAEVLAGVLGIDVSAGVPGLGPDAPQPVSSTRKSPLTRARRAVLPRIGRESS